MRYRPLPNGLFLTFEGPECSGKSTQGELLAAWLRATGYDVLTTREPGGTVVGEELRRVVMHVTGPDAVCAEAELFIFCASRAQHVRKVIEPHLRGGGVVICDRFADSTTAYQGYGRGFDLEVINNLHRIATAGRFPDLTILLDMDVDEQFRRSRERLAAANVDDRFEDETRAFHQRVREGYRAIARREPERVRVVAGAPDRETIHHQIVELVTDALDRLCR